MKIIIGMLLLIILVAACNNVEKPLPVEPDGGIGSTPDSGSAGGTMLTKREAVECTPAQKGSEACTMDYNPVCGYFNQDIQCIKAPCADTYGNACQACADEKVAYYTPGECQSAEDLAKV